MPANDDQRVGVAIAAGLLAEDFSFSTRSSTGPGDTKIRFGEIRLNPNGVEGVNEEITVQLVGAFGVLASSCATHPTVTQWRLRVDAAVARRTKVERSSSP